MEKPGRNDPCWCGSGKKYKKCHIDFDEKIEEFEGAGHIDPHGGGHQPVQALLPVDGGFAVQKEIPLPGGKDGAVMYGYVWWLLQDRIFSRNPNYCHTKQMIHHMFLSLIHI